MMFIVFHTIAMYGRIKEVQVYNSYQQFKEAEMVHLTGKTAFVTGASSGIARVIVKAVTARKPKTRHAAGNMAGRALFFRRLMSDRGFDRMIVKTMA
jgi:hypothetical protein